jgi:hypothetical protein
MRPDIKAVLEAILDNASTLPPECQVCQTELYIYVEAELDGEDPERRYPTIQRHLEACEQCQEAYQALKTLLTMERQNELAEPPVEPTFDFSYLSTQADQESIWQMVEEAGHQALRLFSEIPIRLGQQMASFGRLGPQLKPQPIIMPATRTKQTGPERSGQRLSLVSAEHDVAFGLKIGPMSGRKTTVGIELAQASTQEPLRNARVTLRDNQKRMLESHTIRDSKEVTIQDLEMGSYLVEIKYKKQVWQLPLTLVPAQEPS